ncbi:MAG TPA: alpha/beta hydrolase [Candidatus Dormibacteraeota bacterium]
MIEQAPRARRWIALAVSASSLALAGIGVPASAQAADADTPPVPVLTWTGCGDEFQCTTAQVPLDYARPQGPTISLALVRLPAGDPAHRLGSLLVNPGGPGGSGFTLVRVGGLGFPPELRARFDLVGFDPRGVGLSTPVRCFASQAEQQAFFASRPPFPTTETEDATFIRGAADFDVRCQQRNGALLPHMSTANAARDMDLLREALGDAGLSYLGVSYGTYLGATYANLFPSRVRALVLDGAVEPVEWATGRDGEGSRQPVFLRLKSDLGASRTLGAFLDLCAAARPAACQFAAGSDREATTDRFQGLMARLKQQPIAVQTSQGTQEVTYALTVNVVNVLLYLESLWPLLSAVLQRLDQGDGSLLLEVVGLLAPPSPEYDNTREAQLAVICADADSPRDAYAWPDLAAAADRRAPYFGAYWAWSTVECAGWPARDAGRYTGPFDRRTAGPILVVGNTFDPATRYQSAVALSRELGNARLLTLDGWGHTAFSQPSECARTAEIRYLVDLQLPAPGAVCRPDFGPFDQPVPAAAAPSAAAMNRLMPTLPLR